MKESQFRDKKSLSTVTGKTANWKELAKDCVCFANSRGGSIFIGVEDDQEFPLPHQMISDELPFIIKKRISEYTVNVGIDVGILTAENGGQYIQIKILPSSSTIASTSDGKYYYRSADTCIPLLPDEISRLFTDKPSFIWETKRTTIPKTNYDPNKFQQFISDIKASRRVSDHIKQKSVDELLEHYYFSDGDFLTNLGVLWLGKRNDRAKISYAPLMQFFKYDERGEKVNKILWHNHDLNPKELIEAAWSQIPDWKEGIEVSDGIFRRFIPHYEEVVIRELLANALVHRPYTMRGDIYINLFPDRLEIVNPGLFPIGITPQNILHKNVRRNDKLAQVFFDLHLMDKEGSGIDKIYETLLANGKQIPVSYQGDDFVQFTIYRRVSKPDILTFIQRINEEYQLTQKEMIALGLIVQHNALSALEFSATLNLPNQPNAIRHWLGRLTDYEIVLSKGKTKGTDYFVNPAFLKKSHFQGKTTLKTIEPHRLQELIYKDLSIYDECNIKDIHIRIGSEIPIRKIKYVLDSMYLEGRIKKNGANRWTTYSLNRNL